MKSVSVLVVLATLVACVLGDPLWKVFCQGTPLYRGRVDPIVNPGKLAQHSHKVFGGSNFDLGGNITEVDYYNYIMKSNCTTCSITIDKSVYWIPDLYYQWPNGSLSLVPTGGLTVYYPSRSGSGDQAKPQWKAFPPGLRIVAGSPTRRTYNASNVAHKAISYACLSSSSSGPETGEFPTATRVCDNGLRAQVWFPMCWDGKNLDSADHFSHMAYPIGRPDGGNCPSTHTTRIPGIFFEVLFSVSKFPHGDGNQRFLWSNGDRTGNGLHGDFLNGWDEKIVQQAIADPTCDISNTNFGNSPEKCAPFTPYVKKSNPDQSCVIASKLKITEDLGINRFISHLPGCNPLTGSGANVTACQGSWPQKPIVGIVNNNRTSIAVKSTGKFWSIVTNTDSLFASVDYANLSYSEVFTLVPQTGANAGLVGIASEISLNYMSDNCRGSCPFKFNRNSPSGWEFFTVEYTGAVGPVAWPGNDAKIKANSNGKYLRVNADGSITSNATSAADATIFSFVDPGVTTDTRTSKVGFTSFETTGVTDSTNNLQEEQVQNAASSSYASIVAMLFVVAMIAL
eukprot:TRINITY_DN916_c0_g1_i1.p1 TRINITY_DN916_c0_g1~~TRINITY_DN916_c0_g1_i1.p1  ORF type:complete len:568 (-),score=115.52 TRINITY_DN916_c0_g1_i1:44-1747(-)